MPTISSARYALTIGGQQCGFVDSIEGGNITGKKVETPDSSSHYTQMNLGSVEVAPFTSKLGLSSASPLFDWINRSVEGYSPTPMDGVVTMAGADNRAVRDVVFKRAHIESFKFPKFDAKTGESAKCEIKFQASEVHHVAAKGEPLKSVANAVQKGMRTDMFALGIDGLTLPGVTSVDAIEFKQKLYTTKVASDKALYFPEVHPEKCSFSDLSFTVIDDPETIGDLLAWEQAWFHGGQNLASHEKSGHITLLSTDKKTPLLTLSLFGIGLLGLERKGGGATNQDVKTITVKCYLERVKVQFGG